MAWFGLSAREVEEWDWRAGAGAGVGVGGGDLFAILLEGGDPERLRVIERVGCKVGGFGVRLTL